LTNVRSPRGALPTWAKVLFGIFAVCVVLTAGLVWFAMNMITKVGEGMKDPKASAALAHELVDIEDPLPTGWTYFANVPVGNMVRMVTIRNEKGTVIVNITRYLNKLSKELAEGQARGAKMTIASRGTESLAGQSVYYLRGTGFMRGAGQAAEQVDYGSTRDGGTLTVHIIEVGLPTYDPALPAPLLDHIKSLK
jgi:hypothetical protein